MTQVRITDLAQDFSANHAVAAIYALGDIGRINRLEITGPAAAGIKLGIRGKQRRFAANAMINTGFMVILIAACESAFGGCMTRHFVGERLQLLAPLGVRTN